MSMQLFEHNQRAYEAAVTMLAEKGKAAIIHPTGTGKSFIGFKLCEDNPDKTICWLSPSEYIFKTQLENLADVTDGWIPNNIKFFTYAKLMMMSEDEMREIQPDYLIIDEFHRLGAPCWGVGFQKFLNIYIGIPMLGLSATNIRYLDDQRDMAEELFDGNIASDMTLGEAIVRGILNPPKYVLSIYSYQEDLLKFEDRIKRAKNRASREEAEKYLEALRRALEKADGIDDIFDKNMEDRTGKYIVFCADYEHMRDIIECNIKEWLHKVSADFKIYTFYSGDSESDKSFKAFKEDNDNTCLRLLFCIDALNEGVHVEDISGVILLRPTVSPIIYKQQIGRALSASKSKSPVIFDIVNNIENLYSIDGIKEEMQEAVRYFERNGEGSIVINERFEIIDKIAECREIFSKLEGTLSEGWNLMYEHAREYFSIHGDLEIQKNSEEFPGLASWLTVQRRVYNGAIRGNLTQVQINKLNALNMRWGSKSDLMWTRYYEACVRYKKEHGNLIVPKNYVDGNINLGSFIANIRVQRKSNREYGNLSVEKYIRLLDDIGMVWDISEYKFEQYFSAVEEYYKAHGNIDIGIEYIDEKTGLKLGVWVSNQRKNRKENKLSDEQIRRLDMLGMRWDTKSQIVWNESYQDVLDYYNTHGDISIPVSYESDSGRKTGIWIRRMREKYQKGLLTEEQTEKLNALGMVWELPDSWEKNFNLLKNYYEEHGDLNIPGNYIVNGVWLGKFLCEQRAIGEGKREKQLTDEQYNKLLSIGVQFGKRKKDIIWGENFEYAKQFYIKNGHLLIPPKTLAANGKNLNIWLINQRMNYRQGKLSSKQVKLLESIGMDFEMNNADKSWRTGISHAKSYYEKYGHLYVPNGYKCEDSFDLSRFLKMQRSRYNSATRKLSEKKIKELESIGMIWDVPKYQWEISYADLKRFYEENGHIEVPAGTLTRINTDLNQWVMTQRKSRKEGRLSNDRIILLNKIGFEWLNIFERKWEENFRIAERFYKEHGAFNLSSKFKTSSGFPLGRWVYMQSKRKNKLSAEQIEKLRTIGL